MMTRQDMIIFQGEDLATFTDRGFISIIETFCEPFKKDSLMPLDVIEGATVTPLREGLDFPYLKGFFKTYTLSKCEKFCVTNCILMDRILVSALIIIPEDDYDFPMLVLEWSETEDVISVLVDLVPVADPVISDGYRETYLDHLEDTWKKYVECPWVKPNRFAWTRMLFSPYYLSGAAPKEPEQNRIDCHDIVSKYLDIWVGLLKKAEPMQDKQHREAVKLRKKKIRQIFRANDEGAKTMKQMVDPEIIKKLLLCNF